MGQNEGSCVVSADHLQVVTHIVAFDFFLFNLTIHGLVESI